MRVRVVPSDHPRRFLDGGRHHVRARVKSNAQKPTLNNPHHIREQTRISKGKKKERGGKGYLGLRRSGGEQLGVDLDAVLLPLAPHLRRRPPYDSGRAALARRLQVGQQEEPRSR